jgi:protein TonB
VPVTEAPEAPAPALYPLPAAPPPGSLPGGTGAPGTRPGNGRGTGTGAGTGDEAGEAGGPVPLVERPDRSPVVARFSEPAYPQEARREDYRARAHVRVLVDERGRVLEAAIVRRVRIGRGDREEEVPSLPYGMDQAALDAARRYQFRPAQDDGRRVRSYTTVTLSFGV